jgi:prepilin-type processing-associated H-X9-DG protein
MGEKKTEWYDLYMECIPNPDPVNRPTDPHWTNGKFPYNPANPPVSDYRDRVEVYRHGLQVGSNYLYLDGHVQTCILLKRMGDGKLDPWQIIPVPGTP